MSIIDPSPTSAQQFESVSTLLWIDLQANNAECQLGTTLSESLTVHICRHPDDVTALIAEVKPDVICFEYDQPDVSGLRVLRETKLSHPSLPILMLSDPPTAELALWALRTRVWDYFIRPVSAGEIARRINILAQVTCMQRDQRSRPVFLPQQVLPTSAEMVCADAPCVVTGIAVALAYLHKNFHSKVTLADVAQLCGMGQYEFSRQFKRFYGVTFRDYIIRYRIDKAATMLRDTAMDILAITLATGFNDASHFSRTFRRHHGLTPTAYRLENMPACAAIPTAFADGVDGMLLKRH